MSCSNPTGGDRAVTLTIPAGNEAFLRRVISAARDGLREELERFGDRLQVPRSNLLLEDAVYSALLDGLDRGSLVPDDELLAVVAQLAESVDRDNEHSRVVAEHAAIHDLLCRLEGRSE